MKLKQILRRLDWLPNVALRVTVGYMFLSGAVGKINDPAKLLATFHDSGIPLPALTAPATAWVELVGGAALLLGVATRATSAVLGMIIVGALIAAIAPPLLHQHPNPGWFLSNLFYSSEWLLAGVLAWLMCAGSDRLSIDGLMHSERRRTTQ